MAEEFHLRIGAAAVIGIWRKEALEVSDGLTSSQSSKWNRLTVSFKSLEEAQEWVKELDRKYEARKNAPKIENTMPASAYYSITGYYGD